MSDEVSSVRTTSTVKFLIVDDDMVSVMAMKRALKKLKIVNPVQVAKDGQQALEILRGEKNGAEFTPPFFGHFGFEYAAHEWLRILRRDSQRHLIATGRNLCSFDLRCTTGRRCRLCQQHCWLHCKRQFRRQFCQSTRYDRRLFKNCGVAAMMPPKTITQRRSFKMRYNFSLL